MGGLTRDDMLVILLSCGILLSAARIAGEAARRLNQPAVLGEILAGILLGPSLLGRLSPQVWAYLFPSHGNAAIVLQGLSSVGVILFLLVAGLEVDLSTIWRQGKTTAAVSVSGVVAPFALGLIAARWQPTAMGAEPGSDPWSFALFFATALSISALPVIARTMMDLDLYRTDFGMLVVAAAVANDLIGWLFFAVLLAMMGVSGHGTPVGLTILFTLLFAALMLTVGRRLLDRMLPWIQAHTTWPAGVLGLSLSLALFGAALTEWIGIHAIFGSLLVGVALGDSIHLREQTRATIDRFVSSFFAPLFFASIGLRTDFVANFDPLLALTVLIIACIGKVLGCAGGARLASATPRESWAMGFALNARGAMEIILGLLALQSGLIGERLFVALVIMALVTSMMAGPAVQAILGKRRPRPFIDYLASRAFVPRLKAVGRREVIAELSRAMATALGKPASAIEDAVWNREMTMSTGLEHSLAIPHARLAGLSAPVIGLGLSPTGVDFDAYDGEPSRIIFLILTPEDDQGVQVHLLADIARTFKDPDMRSKVLQVTGATELIALIRTERLEGA